MTLENILKRFKRIYLRDHPLNCLKFQTRSERIALLAYGREIQVILDNEPLATAKDRLKSSTLNEYRALVPELTPEESETQFLKKILFGFAIKNIMTKSDWEFLIEFFIKDKSWGKNKNQSPLTVLMEQEWNIGVDFLILVFLSDIFEVYRTDLEPLGLVNARELLNFVINQPRLNSTPSNQSVCELLKLYTIFLSHYLDDGIKQNGSTFPQENPAFYQPFYELTTFCTTMLDNTDEKTQSIISACHTLTNTLIHYAVNQFSPKQAPDWTYLEAALKENSYQIFNKESTETTYQLTEKTYFCSSYFMEKISQEEKNDSIIFCAELYLSKIFFDSLENIEKKNLVKPNFLTQIHTTTPNQRTLQLIETQFYRTLKEYPYPLQQFPDLDPKEDLEKLFINLIHNNEKIRKTDKLRIIAFISSQILFYNKYTTSMFDKMEKGLILDPFKQRGYHQLLKENLLHYSQAIPYLQQIMLMHHPKPVTALHTISNMLGNACKQMEDTVNKQQEISQPNTSLYFILAFMNSIRLISQFQLKKLTPKDKTTLKFIIDVFSKVEERIQADNPNLIIDWNCLILLLKYHTNDKQEKKIEALIGLCKILGVNRQYNHPYEWAKEKQAELSKIWLHPQEKSDKVFASINKWEDIHPIFTSILSDVSYNSGLNSPRIFSSNESITAIKKSAIVKIIEDIFLSKNKKLSEYNDLFKPFFKSLSPIATIDPSLLISEGKTNKKKQKKPVKKLTPCIKTRQKINQTAPVSTTASTQNVQINTQDLQINKMSETEKERLINEVANITYLNKVKFALGELDTKLKQGYQFSDTDHTYFNWVRDNLNQLQLHELVNAQEKLHELSTLAQLQNDKPLSRQPAKMQTHQHIKPKNPTKLSNAPQYDITNIHHELPTPLPTKVSRLVKLISQKIDQNPAVFFNASQQEIDCYLYCARTNVDHIEKFELEKHAAILASFYNELPSKPANIILPEESKQRLQALANELFNNKQELLDDANLWIYGGFIRDTAFKKRPKDIDVLTELSIDTIQNHLKKHSSVNLGKKKPEVKQIRIQLTNPMIQGDEGLTIYPYDPNESYPVDINHLRFRLTNTGVIEKIEFCCKKPNRSFSELLIHPLPDNIQQVVDNKPLELFHLLYSLFQTCQPNERHGYFEKKLDELLETVKCLSIPFKETPLSAALIKRLVKVIDANQKAFFEHFILDYNVFSLLFGPRLSNYDNDPFIALRNNEYYTHYQAICIELANTPYKKPDEALTQLIARVFQLECAFSSNYTVPTPNGFSNFLRTTFFYQEQSIWQYNSIHHIVYKNVLAALGIKEASPFNSGATLFQSAPVKKSHNNTEAHLSNEP